jgi:hypothetical protein
MLELVTFLKPTSSKVTNEKLKKVRVPFLIIFDPLLDT